jgi:predicted O-linked N-acetylglucosamine transferase (SPINDLY family)
MKLPSGNWLIIGMFNGIEKVNSAVWAAWMQILKQVPNALLWLLDPGPAAQHHLSMSTQLHGVDPRRIVMGVKLPQNEHLSRLGLCDLMLDPWPYGGHTTTSDALFAGVPVVCKKGDNFSGRVSASLLHAAGLRDLVAEDVGQYIDLVVKLLLNNRERSRLKQYIADAVPKSDLFNIKSKTLQLEAAYHEAFNLALKGKAPESIDAVRLIHPE